MFKHLTLTAPPLTSHPAPHLNGLVERLVVFLNELLPDVEQVDLTPGDHDPGEGLLLCASTLVEPGDREKHRAGEEMGLGQAGTHGCPSASLPFPPKPGWDILPLSSTNSPDSNSPVPGLARQRQEQSV